MRFSYFDLFMLIYFLLTLIISIIIINDTQCVIWFKKGDIWLSVATQTLLMELSWHIRQKRLGNTVCLLDWWLPGHWDDNSGLPAGTMLLYVCLCECKQNHYCVSTVSVYYSLSARVRMCVCALFCDCLLWESDIL